MLLNASRDFNPDVWNLLHNACRSVPKQIYFHDTVTQNVQAALAMKHRSKNATTNGDLFELCLYDGLLQHGVAKDNIRYHARSNTYGAEVDFLVRRTDGRFVTILAKKSYRERWKQTDRDALVAITQRDAAIEMFSTTGWACPLRPDQDLLIWAVMWRETPSHSDGQAKRKAETVGRQMVSIKGDRSISVVDDAGMARLLQECLI